MTRLGRNLVAIPCCGLFEVTTAHDRDCAERLLALIASRGDAFSRNPEHGHVTASAVIVSEDFSALLMTHHTKLDRWLQLGGHCDGIRDAPFVAKKEAYEESGLAEIRALTADIIDLDIHAIPASLREPEHLHYDVRYLFQADRHAALQVSSESRALRWIELEALDQISDAPSVLRLRDAIARFSRSLR